MVALLDSPKDLALLSGCKYDFLVCADGDFCMQKTLFKGKFWTNLISSVFKLSVQNPVSSLFKKILKSSKTSHFYEDLMNSVPLNI